MFFLILIKSLLVQWDIRVDKYLDRKIFLTFIFSLFWLIEKVLLFIFWLMIFKIPDFLCSQKERDKIFSIQTGFPHSQPHSDKLPG